MPRRINSAAVDPNCWPTAAPSMLPAAGPRKSCPNSGIWLSWTPALITERSRGWPKSLLLGVIAYNLGKLLRPHEPATAAIQDRGTPHPTCPVLHPPAGRKPVDSAP